MNRLSLEKSPYLLQHKDNPVHWYPWGPEAFQAAKSQNKPILLSIGYATCHWCHVMAHESFEDNNVAAVLNNHFISVKVDREERPDVDHIYMTAAQLMTGGGGWPLTIVMTPDKKPFFSATYIPKHARYGSAGLIDLLEIINKKWQSAHSEIVMHAAEISDTLHNLNQVATTGSVDESLLAAGVEQLARRFDPVDGGFSRGTKFPTPHNLIFLLRYHGAPDAVAPRQMAPRQMALTTLKNMRAGGIFDHLGYGFHRYATDSQWLVPHFEKMLYDQALLLLAYTETYEITGESLYKTVALEISEYVQRQMQSPEGAFYCAEDADSEGVEGKYYVWRQSEIRSLPGNAAELIENWFQVKAPGNFESHATPPQTNILHIDKSKIELFFQTVQSASAFTQARDILLQARAQRIPPLLDDKILTDWNGLMIAALARAGKCLNHAPLIQMAAESSRFIDTQLFKEDGTLRHRFRDGEAAVEGQFDDYAFYIFGLIELYQATFHVDYLQRALALTRQAETLFGSAEGGYYLTTAHATDLIVRPREFFDGALPSGNSVMFENLIRLARITGVPELEDSATRLSRAFSDSARRSPDAHTWFLSGLQFAIGPSIEIVVVGESDHPDTQSLLDAATRAAPQTYHPHKVIIHKTAANRTQLAELAPYTANQEILDNRPTAYVCMNQTCAEPVHTPRILVEQIAELMQ
ncbi:MAG: thioredoxin domain-containing protein [Deltaproteobacteria bacterium]|nr:thioredoxin domain-containing protein [Deltaproteobacteria bacterium]MBN2671070.1 thioredoxin domain-containing protein [Deltaproteobacteria bacterium]